MHNSSMRTTVNLDDSVYEFTSQYAAARGLTLGAAIGELVRRAQTPPATSAAALRRAPNGFPMFPKQGRVLTAQMVKDAQEDEIE